MNAPEILKLSWNKKDGKTEYHYANKPAGHRCGWTCVWLTHPGDRPGYRNDEGHQAVTPKEWGADVVPENMSTEALLCELSDIAARQWTYAAEAYKLIESQYLKSDPGHWRVMVVPLIQNARQGYGEYLNPFNPPPMKSTVDKNNVRPGWEPQ